MKQDDVDLIAELNHWNIFELMRMTGTIGVDHVSPEKAVRIASKKSAADTYNRRQKKLREERDAKPRCVESTCKYPATIKFKGVKLCKIHANYRRRQYVFDKKKSAKLNAHVPPQPKPQRHESEYWDLEAINRFLNTSSGERKS